jgi:hypothetical protein
MSLGLTASDNPAREVKTTTGRTRGGVPRLAIS